MTANSLESIEVIPSGKALGAEVKGLDLSQNVTPAIIARLKAIWGEHMCKLRLLTGEGTHVNEAEFRSYAKAEGYDEPQSRSLPANKFFDTHAHDRDLIVLITAGSFVVDYGDEHSVFAPGDMCHVTSGVDHTDTAGPQGASYLLAWR